MYKLSIKLIVFSVLFSFLSFESNGQQQHRLTIGDSIPELKYSTWIKGKPITSFKEDHVYVFEFWATWCGPCIQAMPHLSKLAKTYEGKVDFVGVNVLERTKDLPYESAQTSVKQFVKDNDDRMQYNVIMDNNEQYLLNNWLRAAGQTGIPSTIVFKNGIVHWIGHPHNLDNPLDSIAKGTFNLDAFKISYERKFRVSSEKSDKLNKILNNIQQAITENNQGLVEKYVEEGINELPSLAGGLKLQLFTFLIEKRSSQEAMGYAQKLIGEYPQAKLSLAIKILEHDGLENKYYEQAILWLDGEQSNSLILERLADRYGKMKNYPKALETIRQAIVKGTEELKDPRYQGRVLEKTIETYRKKEKEWTVLNNES